MQQREMMRTLIAGHGQNARTVIAAYAAAEKRGEVTRKSNKNKVSPEVYALRLWKDGERKG